MIPIILGAVCLGLMATTGALIARDGAHPELPADDTGEHPGFGDWPPDDPTIRADKSTTYRGVVPMGDVTDQTVRLEPGRHRAPETPLPRRNPLHLASLAAWEAAGRPLSGGYDWGIA